MSKGKSGTKGKQVEPSVGPRRSDRVSPKAKEKGKGPMGPPQSPAAKPVLVMTIPQIDDASKAKYRPIGSLTTSSRVGESIPGSRDSSVSGSQSRKRILSPAPSTRSVRSFREPPRTAGVGDLSTREMIRRLTYSSRQQEASAREISSSIAKLMSASAALQNQVAESSRVIDTLRIRLGGEEPEDVWGRGPDLTGSEHVESEWDEMKE